MLKLYDKSVSNRLLLGTASYPSLQLMKEAIARSGTEVITVSLRRQLAGNHGHNPFFETVSALGCAVLPNTAGCKTAREAVTLAQMAREIFNTDWIKLEVIGDDYLLQPDAVELLEATRILVSEGFKVFPYCTDDLILCQRLAALGCSVLMPWGAPIGSGQGLMNPFALKTLRARLPDHTLIVDAGIGKPSDACAALELGFDGVLLNSAVALAHDPVSMAEGFRDAVRAGRIGFEAGIIPSRDFATPSTPVTDMPFWHQLEAKKNDA